MTGSGGAFGGGLEDCFPLAEILPALRVRDETGPSTTFVGGGAVEAVEAVGLALRFILGRCILCAFLSERFGFSWSEF